MYMRRKQYFEVARGMFLRVGSGHHTFVHMKKKKKKINKLHRWLHFTLKKTKICPINYKTTSIVFFHLEHIQSLYFYIKIAKCCNPGWQHNGKREIFKKSLVWVGPMEKSRKFHPTQRISNAKKKKKEITKHCDLWNNLKLWKGRLYQPTTLPCLRLARAKHCKTTKTSKK